VFRFGLVYLRAINYKDITDDDTAPCERWKYMNQFRQLRSGDYHTVLRRFVQPVVGCFIWKKRLRDPNLDPNKLCIPSDEAFALLCLENNYIRWLDIFEKNNHQVPEKKPLDEDRKKKVISNVKPLFTAGGNVYNEPTTQKARGWSMQGIARFNELYTNVIEDRNAYPDFLSDFVKAEKQIIEQQDEIRPPTAAKKSNTLEAAMDAFTDDEDSVGNNYDDDQTE